MRIGGLQKLTLIDYPGKIAAVVFMQGCNFRCRYCHNPELVVPEKYCPTVPEEEVMAFLRTRQDYLEGVVVTGGEPTVQEGLISFLDKLKRLGYLVKLDTNGSRPDVLKQLFSLRLVNYVAMDVKATLSRYDEVTNVRGSGVKIEESIRTIIESGVPHEFRTTVVKAFHPVEDLLEIRSLVAGARQYNLQKARIDGKILDKGLLAREQYSDAEFERLKEIVSGAMEPAYHW
ncbi:MAG: anaerobic ribonucleoside-triphosphate reductase activating protein [Candidatus Omnitrophica bacterium]|nr:anaerobic ribonucleoside-triphosphate reductase activating protein [Candidatus Omnitrophota bacterium]